MFNQRSRYVVIGIAVMSLKSAVQVLGDSLSPFGKQLLISVGLQHSLSDYHTIPQWDIYKPLPSPQELRPRVLA